GMTVSLISSVFMGFGSGIWAEGAVLQNRGFGFSLDPAHPNVVAGRKRPFHTIIPAMVRSGSRTRIVFGVTGGPMQPQGQVQVLVHLLDHGLDPAAALARPRAFWLAKEAVGLEAGLPPVVAARFEAAGWEPSIDFPSDVMGVGQVV